MQKELRRDIEEMRAESQKIMKKLQEIRGDVDKKKSTVIDPIEAGVLETLASKTNDKHLQASKSSSSASSASTASGSDASSSKQQNVNWDTLFRPKPRSLEETLSSVKDPPKMQFQLAQREKMSEIMQEFDQSMELTWKKELEGNASVSPLQKLICLLLSTTHSFSFAHPNLIFIASSSLLIHPLILMSHPSSYPSSRLSSHLFFYYRIPIIVCFNNKTTFE